MANKLNKEYPSITETKNILKMNPNISVDAVKSYDRRARNSEFIMEHVKIIERLTNEITNLKEENKKQKVLIVNETIEKEKFKNENDTRKDIVDGMVKTIDELEEENEKLEKQMQGAQYSKGICDELSKQIKQLKEEKINQN